MRIDKVKRHGELCEIIHSIYEQKNKAYGDSFGDTYKKLGIISAVTRITDKYNRLVNLTVTREKIGCGDESITDTLYDLANYALMTAMELEVQKSEEDAFLYTE